MSDQSLFFFFTGYILHASVNKTLFLSFNPHMHAHTHTHSSRTVCATQPRTVRHRQPAWNTLLPCSTCLPSNAVLSAAASVKSFNLLHVFPYTEPSLRQQSNTCKNKQIVRSRRTCIRKVAPKNICAYPICHYEWQGLAELRQGRAELLASAWKVSSQHHGERHWFQSAAPGQLQHWQLDSSTDWLSGVKETREPSPGTGRSGVRKAGCNPGEAIRDWN